MILIACNWELMRKADYQSVGAIKWLLFNIDDLTRSAENGDGTAASIYVDIKRALSVRGVLTFKQRRYIHLWHEGYSLTEIATKYRLNPSTVQRTINKGIGNISLFLKR